jgi:hypothetical protein
MLRSFDELPDHSRVWIYTSDRPFAMDEEILLQRSLENFIDTWSAHGKDLAASAKIEFSQIIIIALDEQQAMATGCSIDKQFQLIQAFEKQLGLNLLNRMIIPFLTKEGIELRQMSDVDSNMSKEIILDNTIQRLSEFRTQWEKKAEESWMQRLF